MLKFIEDTHSYELDGKPLVSVTRVIRDVLKGESEFVANQYAMDFGSCVHKTLELLDKNNLGEYDQRMQPYIDAWVKFKEDYNVKWMECEIPCASEIHRFAGTIDRIAGIGDELAIIDIKTGNSYKEYPLQTAAYKLLVEEQHIRKISKRYCVMLSTEGYKVEEHNNPQDEEVFLSCLKVWKWRKNKL